MTKPVETYEQAIEYLYNRINYEHVHADRYSAGDFKLDRMRQLLRLLGDPHLAVPAIHIAGTKGKGSTAALVSEILTATGLKVGLFTSPHIDVFEERIRFNGVMATPTEIIELVNRVSVAVAELDGMPGKLNPTYFEIATAMAWLFFHARAADVAVLEVGLGGRLDSTNLCSPLVTIITSISRDHTQILGSTLTQIAAEKAGIAKPDVPLICGATDPEALSAITEICEQQSAKLYNLGEHIQVQSRPAEQPSGTRQLVSVETPWSKWTDLPLSLAGEHQARNAGIAVAAVDLLRQRHFEVSEAAITSAMSSVRWPLRIEVIQERPTVVVDAAHNWQSVKELLRTLDDQFTSRRRLLIFSTTVDKDVAGMLRQLLPRFDTTILTQYQDNPRAVPIEELHRLVRRISTTPVHTAADPTTAWRLARRLASPDELICVTGSFFIAAEIREAFVDSEPVGAEPENVQ